MNYFFIIIPVLLYVSSGTVIGTIDIQTVGLPDLMSSYVNIHSVLDLKSSIRLRRLPPLGN